MDDIRLGLIAAAEVGVIGGPLEEAEGHGAEAEFAALVAGLAEVAELEDVGLYEEALGGIGDVAAEERGFDEGTATEGLGYADLKVI